MRIALLTFTLLAGLGIAAGSFAPALGTGLPLPAVKTADAAP
ncbi:hypothetical protein [Azospirillum sp.]|nr:hypothetical protein [Azospirillum sp.]HYF89212.1 hypothetical protein [Azospirillum sp.]